MTLRRLTRREFLKGVGAIAGTAALSSLQRVTFGQEELLIGGVGPLSAPGAAESGTEMKIAMEMAIEELGTALGRPLRLQFEDTRGLPEEGSAAMNRLADSGAVGVVGEFHSAVAKAEIEVANARKLPFIISEAWADVLTAKQYKYVFRIAPANSLFYTKVADWIRAIGSKNVVAIVENTDWGLGVDGVIKGELIEAARPNIHGDPVSYTSIVAERTVTDFTPHLLRFKSMEPRPDLVMDIFTGTGEYLIVKQAAEIGLATTRETAIFPVGTSALFPEYWETVGQAGVFGITKTGYHPTLGVTPAVKEFSAKFEARTGRTPTFAAMESWDSVQLMVRAIEAAGSTDPDAIVGALEEIRYDGVLGTLYFSLEREPAYMYHQWPGARAVVIQYTESQQNPNDALLLWPAILRP